MLLDKVNTSFIKLMLIAIISIGVLIIASCNLIHDVQQGTAAIEKNRLVVESSTKVIAANKEAVESSNDMVAKNRDLIQQTNQAIKANADIISRSTAAIQGNIAAIEASSLAIRKNGEAIQQSTQLLSQLSISPLAMNMAIFVIVITLFLIPILMVVFMWRIHRDIRLLLLRK